MSLAGHGWCDIDFDADGKRVDHLFIPHSVDRSAYGNVGIPIVVIKNGDGPTILLTGGTHGDEFEGQIVATRVARAIEPAAIRGQLIVIPCLNFPAATSGTRVSPLDGGNLNRAFPGDPRGGVTQQLAHYLHTVLMPMADVMIDVHSGGASLEYLPTAFTNLSGNSELDRAAVKAMRVFGAPLSMLFRDDSEARRAVSSAHLNDCLYFATEMGGRWYRRSRCTRNRARGHGASAATLRAAAAHRRLAADQGGRAHPLRPGTEPLLPGARRGNGHL